MVRTLRVASEGDAAVSFDAGQPAPERELAGAMVYRVLSRLLERASGVARLETRVDGRLVAASRIGLGGDCTSAIVESETRTDLDRHVRSQAEISACAGPGPVWWSPRARWPPSWRW